MNDKAIIASLLSENSKLQSELEEWKAKYFIVEKAYAQLTNTGREDRDYFSEALASGAETAFCGKENYKSTQSSSETLTKEQAEDKCNEILISLDVQQKAGNSLVEQKQRGNGCKVIEGCFILQKRSQGDTFDSVRFVYPDDTFRPMLNIVYRYTFVNEHCPEIEDDAFDSRKNEINFGSPFEDIRYMFDDSKNTKENYKRNEFEIQTNLFHKRYVFGVVRPDIVVKEGKYYETEVVYGFISSVPFSSFFSDLNRVFQQQIKLQMLKAQGAFDKDKRIEIMSILMRQLVRNCVSKNLQVTGYPIDLEIAASLAVLKLGYHSAQAYRCMELISLSGLLNKFVFKKIARILHCLLTENHLLLVCKSRRSLNSLMEAIKIMLYPFNWIFPIIYFYSPFFEPFLQSPMPLIIGLWQTTVEQANDQHSMISKLPQHDFVTIFADDQETEDINIVQQFEQRVSSLGKKLHKGSDKSVSVKQNSIGLQLQISGSAKQIDNYLQNIICKLDEEGKTDSFLSGFRGSQMVALYKEMKAGSTKKKRGIL